MTPLQLPDVRRLFIPDPGYLICEMDLERADAQVVAWEAGDEKLKKMFRENADIHKENARVIFGPTTDIAKAKQNRQLAKVGVHATNYGASPRTLGAHLQISTADAERFQSIWFAEHFPIRQWHDRVRHRLQTTRSVVNRFGFQRRFFGRIDDSLLGQALAWVPQSTVGLVINKAWLNFHRHLPAVEVLLQVHDSLVFQFRKEHYPAILPELRRHASIVIPYPDPLTIPVSFKVSDKSWGECEKVNESASH